jgi:hypothetical protein
MADSMDRFNLLEPRSQRDGGLWLPGQDEFDVVNLENRRAILGSLKALLKRSVVTFGSNF